MLFRSTLFPYTTLFRSNVEQMPSNAMEDPNNLLMHQPDGSFREASIEAAIWRRPPMSRFSAVGLI